MPAFATPATPGEPATLAHWHGRLGLRRSLWAHLVGPWLLLFGALEFAATALGTGAAAPQAAAIGLVLGWPVLLSLTIWGAVGAWRAALGHRRAGAALSTTLTALLVIVLVALATAASLGLHTIPNLKAWRALAAGRDPLGAVQISVGHAGRSLRLQGHLGAGDGERVREALRAAPDAVRVELALDGGRLAEALQLAEAVRQRRLATRASGDCGNACTVVLLAGSPHELAAASRLALHRPPAQAINPLWRTLARQQLEQALSGAGMASRWVERAVRATATLPWHPGSEELAAIGLAGVRGRPLDIHLPPPGGPQAEELALALLSHPVWPLVERRAPGAVAAAAGRMAELRSAGSDDEGLQLAAQRLLRSLTPALLQQGSPQRREQYLELARQRHAAAAPLGDEACRAWLRDDAAWLRGLPEALVAAEAAWLSDAVAEVPAAQPPEALNALEGEVLRRALGEDRVDALTRHPPWGAREGEARACDAAGTLLADVLRLPPGERRLAMRLMFDRPRATPASSPS